MASDPKAPVVLPPLEIVPAQRGRGRPPKNPILKGVHHLNDAELQTLAKEAGSRVRSSMTLWLYLNLDDVKTELRELIRKGKKDDAERIKLIQWLLDKHIPPAPKEESDQSKRPPIVFQINNLPTRGRAFTTARPVGDLPRAIDHVQAKPPEALDVEVEAESA